MQNWLHSTNSIQFFLLWTCFLFAAHTTQAQIKFNYLGPDTIFVDSSCTGVLDWGHPANPVVTCTLSGCAVTSVQFGIDDGWNIGDTIPLGTTVSINYQVMTNTGLELDTTVNIFFGDSIPPTFDSLTLPQSISVNCFSDIPPPPQLSTITATDPCSSIGSPTAPLTITYEGPSPIPDTCAGGTFTRTWQATDHMGNATIYEQFITIEGDTLAPTFTVLPAVLQESCETADYNNWINTQRSNIQVTDDGCGPVTLTDNAPTSFDESCDTVFVTFTASDNCNNLTEVTVAYIVIDDTPPAITPPSQTDVTLYCINAANDPINLIQSWGDSSLMAADNCNAVSWTNNFSGLSGGCSPLTGSQTVTYFAQDECGNVDSISIDFTVLDTTPPNLLQPATNMQAACDTAGYEAILISWLDSLGGGQAQDYCTPADSLITRIKSNGIPITSGAIIDSLNKQLFESCIASIDIEFEFEDLCGNSNATVATFTVTDITDPIWDNLPSDLIIQCDQHIDADSIINDWLANNGGGTAFDYCSNVRITNNYNTLIAGCGSTGSTFVTFTARDSCGNTAPQTVELSIVDTIPPQFIKQPSDTIIECSPQTITALNNWIDQYGGAAAEDGCDDVSWDSFSFITSDSVTGNNITFGNYANYPSPNSDCNWFAEVTFFVEDECGNTDSIEATFTVSDITPPVISAIADTITLNCGETYQSIQPDFSDNCVDSLIVTYSENTFSADCPYKAIIERTWTATDSCGNMTTRNQYVKFIDTSSPQLIGVPSDTLVSCDQIPTTPIIGVSIIAQDNCDSEVAISFSETNTQGNNPENCGFYNYFITRIWTATDSCGNEQSAVQIIEVRDTTAPTFTLPPDITINCQDVTNMGIQGFPSALSDNCDISPDSSFQDIINAGSCTYSYSISRTWKVEDACGNFSTGTQLITVQDTAAPVLNVAPSDAIISCTSDAEAEMAFQTWLTSNGGANAIDNCGLITWFAAVPGSYDLADPGTFPGTPVLNLPPANCPTDSAGIYRSAHVDFVAYDECFNAIRTSASFQVIDNSPPVIVECPEDVTLQSEADICGATYTIIPPLFMEDCANNSMIIGPPMAGLEQNLPITSAIQGDIQTPVNPVTINFGPVPTSPTIATDSAVLVIELNLVDGEGNTEFFEIFGENGVLLGQTNATDQQCGQSTTQITISPAQINNWSNDGMITITLNPNIPFGLPGSFAINDICPAGPPTGGGSSVTGSLSYPADQPTNIRFEYQVNGQPKVLVDPVAPVDITLEVGENDLTYFYSDCAGNATSCSNMVTVEDTQPPQIICPDNITVGVDPNQDCTQGVEVILPSPVETSDNCGFEDSFAQLQPTLPQDAFITFSYEPNYLDFVADDKSFTFTNTSSNASGNVVQLTITSQGDVENAEEFFTILGEDGTLIGTTESGQPNVTITPGICDTTVVPSQNVAVFNIPTNLYNDWASDGEVTISAVSNTTFTLPPPGIIGDGINPYCAFFPPDTLNGLSDGVSTITAEIFYEQVTPFYFVEGATNIPLTPMPVPSLMPVDTFNFGTSTVFYIIEDQYGNNDTCSFDVDVIDDTPPVAICQPHIIFINPSGFDDYILQPSEIDGGSFDNCGIDSFFVSIDTFECQQAGTTVPVTLTVTDEAGNSHSCVSLVKVESLPPMPTYNVGLCGSDTLQLMANPPATSAPNDNFYTFNWTGPPPFSSTQRNPVIPNASPINSGTYSVTVTGINGCTSSETVEVVVNAQPNAPSISASAQQACLGDTIQLQVQSYTGNNVTYYWYLGTAPGGVLVDSTTTPSISISPNQEGNYSYYAEVLVDGCRSNTSPTIQIQLTEPIVASTTNDPVIQVCEGDTVALGTSISGPGITYSWTGPDGYDFSTQFPPVLNNISMPKAGTYILIINKNGCPSEPVFTEVIVDNTPDQPVINYSGPTCEGTSFTLTANVTNGDVYTWQQPNFVNQTTTEPFLLVNNATTAMNGNWTLEISEGNCTSPPSAPLNVSIEAAFQAQAQNNGPVCEGDEVSLEATFVPNATYQWSGPDTFSSLNPTPVVNNPQMGNYTVVITSPNGCIDSAATFVETLNAPEITAVSNTATPCVSGNTDILLVATVFPPDNGTYTYEWTGPDSYNSTLPQAVISNATSNDNGPYNLIVTDTFGCSSIETTTDVDVINTPVTPVLSPVGPISLCEGETFALSTNGYTGQVIYIWNTPLGTDTTSIPSYTINQVQAIHAGTYSVFVSREGCESNFSGETTLQVTPKPQTPMAMAEDFLLCAGDTIKLSTDFIPNAIYEWIGPSPFSPSNVHNPVISPAQTINEGEYQVRTIINGCASDFSPPITVLVKENPAAPTVANNGPICLDDPDAEIILSIINGTSVPGASYSWFDADTDQQIGSSSPAQSLIIDDLSGFTEGVYDFYLIATKETGCSSSPSNVTTVALNAVPDIEAFAGNDLVQCEGSTITLNANPPDIGTGNWMQISGPLTTINTPNQAITTIGNLQLGQVYQYSWTLSNGACLAYDADTVQVQIDTDAETAEAGNPISLCNDTFATLNAIPSFTGATTTWTQPQGQNAIIEEPDNPNTTVSNLSINQTYTFTYTLSNEGCGVFSSDQVVIQVFQASSDIAFAGADGVTCGADQFELDAQEETIGTGFWSAVNPEAEVLDPEDPQSLVLGLLPGENQFVWTIGNEGCGNFSRDTVNVFYEPLPLAADDIIEVPFAKPASFFVLENDQLFSEDYTINIATTPQHGTVEFGQDAFFRFTPDPTYSGLDQFIYEVCSKSCPDNCDQATVRLEIGNNLTCDIPSIITPNNDGINDAFVVACFSTDRYPQNSVSIFNQWGDEIFRASPYQNDWEGTYNGNPLPVGTYYYIVEFGNGETPQAGFLMIEK